MKVLLMRFNSIKRVNIYEMFRKYSHKSISPDCFELNDPSLVILKVDVSRVPFLFKLETKSIQNQISLFCHDVIEALPKTWTVLEYELGNMTAFNLVFSIGDGMADLVSNSPLYRFERLNDCPLIIYSSDRTIEMYDEIGSAPDPCVLDKGLWNLICQTLNSESKRAFSVE